MDELKPCPACGGEVKSSQEYTAAFVYCKSELCLSLGLTRENSPFLDEIEDAHNNQWCFQQLQKQKEITEKLKESNEFYANSNNWQTPESQGFRVDDLCLGVADMIEEIDSRNSNLGGNLARQIKKEVEEMEKLK